MGLAINTPKGRWAIAKELEAMEKFQREHPELTVMATDKDKDSVADGFLVKDGDIIGLYETKCRNMTLEQLTFYGTWLITNKKLRQCAEVSRRLRIPFFGVLYLIPDKALVIWQITDDEGEYTFDFEVRRTRTRKTINGGNAYRENAFLPVDAAMKIIE